MRQFLVFCIVGAANTLLGLLIIYALKLFAGAPDALANAVGYALGMTISFLANKKVTFAHEGDFWGTGARFALVQAIAYALNLATVLLLIRAGLNSYLAQAAGVVPYSLTGFFGSKLFVFVRASNELAQSPLISQPKSGTRE